MGGDPSGAGTQPRGRDEGGCLPVNSEEGSRLSVEAPIILGEIEQFVVNYITWRGNDDNIIADSACMCSISSYPCLYSILWIPCQYTIAISCQYTIATAAVPCQYTSAMITR